MSKQANMHGDRPWVSQWAPSSPGRQWHHREGGAPSHLPPVVPQSESEVQFPSARPPRAQCQPKSSRAERVSVVCPRGGPKVWH